MPIVIKEIQVKTVVEKKVVLEETIAESIYAKLRAYISEEVSEKSFGQVSSYSKESRKKER